MNQTIFLIDDKISKTVTFRLKTIKIILITFIFLKLEHRFVLKFFFVI